MTKILKTDDLPVLIDDPLPVFVRFPTGELVPLVRAGAVEACRGPDGKYGEASGHEDEYGWRIGASCWVLDAAYSPETVVNVEPPSPVVWLPWDGAHRLSVLGDREVTVEGSRGQSWTGRASEYASHPLVPKNPIRWAEAQTVPPIPPSPVAPIPVPVAPMPPSSFGLPPGVVPYVGWADWKDKWPEGVPDNAVITLIREASGGAGWQWEGNRNAWIQDPEAAPGGSTWCVKSWGPE